MKSLQLFTAMLIISAQVGCGSEQFVSRNRLSVEQLVDRGKEYDQHIVLVHGYISYGFENCVLTPEPPDKLTRDEILKYSIWYWDEGCMSETKNFRNGYATVYGTYQIEDKGHLGSFTSSIAVQRLTWGK